MNSKRRRLLITRRLPDEVERHMADHFDVTRNELDRSLSRNQLLEAMREFDAICCTITDKFDADLLSVPNPSVRILANFGAGYEHIDVSAASGAGIVVTNTPDVLTGATSELAMLLMLMAARRAGEGERELRSGRWTGWGPTDLIGQSLDGKFLGLVGFGRIARATAKRARSGFGMRIGYFSRSRAAPEVESELGATYFPSLEELAENADVLSLHASGGAETRHMINDDVIARLPRSAILINSARGSLVDEEALARALMEKRIAAAGLDVYEEEPVVNAKLLSLENVVLLPHLGSATREARIAMGMRAAANLEAFFRDGQPLDRVA